MSPEEQRIAIAQACGLGPVTVPFKPNEVSSGHKGRWFTPEAASVLVKTYKSCAAPKVIPDYPNDLNAMHEAEKVFDSATIDTKSLYWDYLCLCVEMPKGWEDSFLRDYAMIRATAAQRAEAFLRTLNVWKE